MSEAIDLRLRPPLGEFLQQRMYRNPTRLAAALQRRGFSPPASMEHRSADLLFREMAEAGVRWGVLGARMPNAEIGGTPNEAVAEMVRRFPDHFLGIVCYLSVGAAKATATLEECSRLGALGIAIEPGIEDPPIYADDRRLYPIYERLVAAKLPVFITGGDSGPDVTYASPIPLDRVCRDFPELQVVAVHGGWPWVHETLGVALRRPNLWVMPDMYWANLPGQAEYTMAATGFLQDRMLFGTSYPAVNIGEYVDSLRRGGLSDAAWQAIAVENPRRLLRLAPSAQNTASGVTGEPVP